MNKPAELIERANDYLDTAADFEHFPANGEEEVLDMQPINRLIKDMRDHISGMGEPKVGLPEKLWRYKERPEQFVIIETINQIIDYLTQQPGV